MAQQTQQQRRQKTRTAIIDAALQEFAELGFAGARFESIAKRAQVNRASIFYYFDDKDALYKELLEEKVVPYIELVGQLLDTVQAAIEDPTAITNVISGASMQVDYIEAEPEIARIVVREMIDHNANTPTLLWGMLSKVAVKISNLLRLWQGVGNAPKIDPMMTTMAVFGASVMGRIVAPMFDDPTSQTSNSNDVISARKDSLVALISSLLGIDLANVLELKTDQDK